MEPCTDEITVEEEKSIEEVPWTIRDILLGIGAFILFMGIIFGVLFGLTALGIKVDTGLAIFLGEAVLILPVWVIAGKKYQLTWQKIGLRKFWPGYLFLGVGLMAVYYLINLLYSLLILAPLGLSVQGDTMEMLAQLKGSVWLWLGAAVAAPLAEETFFRGFLFAGLRKSLGWQKAAIISSLLFALMHLEWTAIFPIFMIGFIFAYLYQRSNSIWPAVILHVGNNLMALCAVSFFIQNMS